MELNDLTIIKQDEVYVTVDCEKSIARELNDYFTFFVPGYKFMPSYRNRVWDGKIRLFHLHNHKLYAGLINHLQEFCVKAGYTISIPDEYISRDIDSNKLYEFIELLNLHVKDTKISMRDYQFDAFVECVRNRRILLLSPTASGKSLIIYALIRYYLLSSAFEDRNNKILIVVPTTSLVEQMYKDFRDYSHQTNWKVGKHCHRLYYGKEKKTRKSVIISTWQSIYDNPKEFFKQFIVCVGDEAHGFKAKSMTDMMTAMVNCRYRIGTTGTLDGTKTHKLVLEGLFGSVHQVISTKNLITDKVLAEMEINVKVLVHSDPVTIDKYQDEITCIISSEKRNEYIISLIDSLEGNTLVLYQYVENHGQVMVDMLDPKRTYFVHGGVDAQKRERIRAKTEKSTDRIIIASYGTFSTGINIKNINNIILSSPTKSRIRSLQSIGRGLRRSETKDKVKVFDLADDFTNVSTKSYTLKHFIERVKIYNEEDFDYNMEKVIL